MSRSALLTSVRRLRSLLAAQEGGAQSDEQLLAAFADRRDEIAFATLVRRHGPMVLGVCRRVLGHVQDAEDAYQATFLVLARRAAALRDKTALASFLHGTAYHMASKIRRAAGRRRKYEGQASARSPIDPADELLWREVRELLDEEIARLPEKYRSVFVLCCLENLSRAEAGQRLGLKERTVLSRLAEARKRLSQRLARRGVELTAVLATTALAASEASALPTGLMAKTIQAALATAAGEKLAGVVSAAVAELVQGATTVMVVSKAKIATVVLLAASMLAGAGAWAYRGLAANTLPPSAHSAEVPAAKADDKPKAASPQREAAKTVDIRGRVLGVDGKPKSGAKLHLLNKDGEIKRLGVSAANGRFTVTVPKVLKTGLWPALIAQSEGAGLDFLSLAGWQPAKPVELRLVEDHPIRGRVINTEGKPIPGVHVGVRTIDVFPNNSLDSFLIAWKKRPFNQGPPGGEKLLWFRETPLLTAITNADGRFVLSGVGAERFAELDLQGGGIATTRLAIVNRDGFDAKPYNQASLDNIPKGAEQIAFRMILHGPNVSVVAEPEKLIHGVVKDADSGKELPNVVLHLEPSDEVAERTGGKTRTDEQGRYEFHGIRRAKAYRVVSASDSSRGYLACQVHLANNTAGYAPLTANLRLKKGVVITGKVIDRATGKSVPGVAKVGVLFDNPFAKDYQRFEFDASAENHWKYWADTGADGTFRVVTIPGPVLLMGRSDEDRVTENFLDELKYKPPKPDAKYPQYFSKLGHGSVHPEYYVYGGGRAIVQGNFCKVLKIKPGTAVVHQDIVLERASSLMAKIQDADGGPVAGVWATDFASSRFTQPLWVEGPSCSVYSLEARRPRLLVFYEPKKRIVGSRALMGGEKGPIVVQLGATGAIKGRLLDAAGQPLAGVVVDVSYRHYAARQIHQLMHRAKQAVTDVEGAFTLDELIPKLKFDLSIHRGKRRFEREPKAAEATIQVKPSECRDLGDINVIQARARKE